MDKIILIDYYGNCDASGRAVGHSPKALMEYRGLLGGQYRVEAVLTKCIANEIDCSCFDKVEILPYQIVEEGSRNLGKRILDKVKLIKNISLAMQKTGKADLWFYRTDFFLFLFFTLRRKPLNKKMFCLVYQQNFLGGRLGSILNFIYSKGLRKFDGVIYTQENLPPRHMHTYYMPDYYYDDDRYGKYGNIKKKRKAICLGTMGPYKKLEELIEVFEENGIPLEIYGKFFDHKRFENLRRKAGRKIIIENVILPQETYYKKLAEAQYTVLPYDMRQYKGRTSGVLLEALFVQTIAIAPSDLLKENGMPGIGYERLRELSRAEFIEEKGKGISEKLAQRLRDYPTKKEIEKGILDFLKGDT